MNLMRIRSLLLCVLLLYVGTSLTASSSQMPEGEFTIRSAYSTPLSIEVRWEPHHSAAYYDVYLDNRPMARVTDSSRLVIGSNDNPLYSHRRYDVLVVARTSDDQVVGKATTTVETSGWEGRYRWVNQTKSTNRGRATQLDFRVTYADGAYQIDALYDRWYRVFPLVESAMVGQQYSWDGEGEVQQAYRANAQVFNTTTIKPQSWQVVSMAEQPNVWSIDVRSKSGAIEVVTHSVYHFVLSDEGAPQLHFSTTSDGIAALSMFHSPNKGEGGIFKAQRI